MSLDTKVKNLIINTNMTKEQYEAIDDKSNQLFFVEDSSVVDVPAPEENQSGYLHTDGTNLTWKEIESGDKLPDQTDNAGKFLTTDGTTASWGDRLIINDYSVSVGVGAAAFNGSDSSSVAIGYNAKAVGTNCVLIGRDTSHGPWNCCTSIGAASSANATYAVAVGYNASVVGAYGIQLGGGTNNDANTFKVANANGNFEMMDADGKVPLDRLTYVTDQIGDISTALTSILGE